MHSHYFNVTKCDNKYGIGNRVSITFSGCKYNCDDCFNHKICDYRYGIPYITHSIETEINMALEEDDIQGLLIICSYSGLMEHNIDDIHHLVWNVKEYRNNKDIHLWMCNGSAKEIIWKAEVYHKYKYILENIDYLTFVDENGQKIWHRNDGKWEIYEE